METPTECQNTSLRAALPSSTLLRSFRFQESFLPKMIAAYCHYRQKICSAGFSDCIQITPGTISAGILKRQTECTNKGGLWVSIKEYDNYGSATRRQWMASLIIGNGQLYVFSTAYKLATGMPKTVLSNNSKGAGQGTGKRILYELSRKRMEIVVSYLPF